MVANAQDISGIRYGAPPRLVMRPDALDEPAPEAPVRKDDLGRAVVKSVFPAILMIVVCMGGMRLALSSLAANGMLDQPVGAVYGTVERPTVEREAEIDARTNEILDRLRNRSTP